VAKKYNTFTHIISNSKKRPGVHAKSKTSNSKKRPGVHAKSKTSNSKQAKNYKKKYRGQGR
jgi:hypothetical protein